MPRVVHPRYAFSSLSAYYAAKCVCGGIRFHHAAPPDGCDDCAACTEFTPVEEGAPNGVRA